MSDDETKSQKIGAAWNPRTPGKAMCSGSVTVRGWKQRFSLFPNTDKTEGSKQPDYVLVSWDEPEEDSYGRA